MRLPGFPVPAVGETVHSVVSRHLQRTAGPRSRSLDLIGLRHTAAHALVPLQLEKLVNAMPHGHPWFNEPRSIVISHTLVPLYLHFTEPHRRSSLIASLQSNSSANPAASLGLTVDTARLLSAGYKFCPECLRRDLSTNGRGFSVAYREHQPPFVRICAEHLTSLLYGCLACRSSRKSLSMWHMSGQCVCRQPQYVPAHIMGKDSAIDTSFIWLAKQVRTILSDDHSASEVPLAARLRSALRCRGFAAGSGLDSGAILAALNLRYGQPFLRGLDIPSSTEEASGIHWPGRILGSITTNGERTPNVLRALLLLGLVSKDVNDFYLSPIEEVKPSAPRPKGYGTPRELTRKLLPSADINAALQASKGKISKAAYSLGVGPSHLVVDMQRQGIRLDLPACTARRLGAHLIAKVRCALQTGIPKTEIASLFGVSKWSIQLIELDSPKLRTVHREVTVDLQRDTHRNAILHRRQTHPTASRSEILRACKGAWKWLLIFDKEWLGENLPEVNRTNAGVRARRINWRDFDIARVVAIRKLVRTELEKQDRPTRLTTSRLLRSVGAIGKNPTLVPLSVAEAKRGSESEEAYMLRRINWALFEYSQFRIPLSMNQFRRIASLHPNRILQFRGHIRETAMKLGLEIDARCAIAEVEI